MPDGLKESVACVIRRSERPSELLAVLRPEDDAELPGVWGLPAASRRPGESWEDAVARVGRDKLGATLRPGRLLAQGDETRPGYRLRMRLYEAELGDGEPEVPQPVEGVTQYAAWCWAERAFLEPGARQGSLCCRLYLETHPGARRPHETE
jgi:ADP-ribose pyrophosphatase YjhB (NUDIX family)